MYREDRDSYHHGDLRRAILEAAERLVAREGPDRVSLRAIAREAGVSSAAPYHHFEDRESILAGVAAAGFRTLGAALVEALTRTEPVSPLDPLRAAGVAYVRFAVDNPEVFRLMFGGALSDRERWPELKEASGATWGVLESMLRRGGPAAGTAIGIEGRAVRPDTGRRDGSGLPVVAVATWSLVHGLAFLLIEGMLDEEAAMVDPDATTWEVLQLLGPGLRAHGALEGDTDSRFGPTPNKAADDP